jgi:lipopolysaccharide heptosyltransferase II
MIGDLVMLSPAIRALRQHYPEGHIAILGQPASIEPYKHHPGVNQLIPYDRSRGDLNLASFRETCAVLRAHSFDTALIFHNSFGSALMARVARVPERVGYRHEFRDFLLTTRLRPAEHRQHGIETRADLLRLYGIPVSDLHEEIHVDEARASVWLRDKLGPNFGRNRPILAVSLGANVEFKRWSAEALNRYLNMFPVNSCDIAFLGQPGDRPLYEGVYSYNNTVTDLIGQTTLEELTWVLGKADLYVGPDGAPVHLAIGRGTPVVALFGPTDPTLCGPYKYEPSVSLRAGRICPRCEARHGKHIRQCLHTIDPEEVYIASVGLLARYCPRWSYGFA